MTAVGVTLGTLLLILTISGLFFNVYILFFCSKTNNQSRSASQILLVHLGLLNVVLSLSFFAIFMPHLFNDAWLEEKTCSVVGPLWDWLHIVAIWTVASLNADKYITIASPLHYARFVSPSKAGLALLVTWLFASAIVASFLFIPGLSYKIKSPVCVLDTSPLSQIAGETHAVIVNCLGFVIPILVVTLTNGKILIIARHHRHRIVSALWDVTLSAQATVTHQKSHFYLTSYKGRSAATTISQHVGSLFVIYLPTAACRIYEAVTKLEVNSYLATIAFVLLAVSPTINGFVYGVRNKILRKLFMHVLRKQIYKSEVSCEIQARTPSVSGSRRPSITPSITLPLQKQLTRRMSEIFTPTSATTSASSQNSGDSRCRLDRQSSDISSSRGRSSECSTPKDLTPPPFRIPETPPLAKHFPKAFIFYKDMDPNIPPSETSNSPPFFTSTQNRLASYFNFTKQSSLDLITNGSGHNGGHRQSLRRALFARNKQKSLDLDMTQDISEKPDSVSCPPRSASHHEMQEQPLSPSGIRPLVLQTEPLNSGRRVKKVSWSSDSFSNSQELPFSSETIHLHKRTKKKASFKGNEFSSKQIQEKHSKYKFNSEMDGNKSAVNSGKHLNRLSSDEVSEEKDLEEEYSPVQVNVFDNPLSNNIPYPKQSKLYSAAQSSLMAKIHVCL